MVPELLLHVSALPLVVEAHVELNMDVSVAAMASFLSVLFLVCNSLQSRLLLGLVVHGSTPNLFSVASIHGAYEEERCPRP